MTPTFIIFILDGNPQPRNHYTLNDVEEEEISKSFNFFFESFRRQFSLVLVFSRKMNLNLNARNNFLFFYFYFQI